MTTTTPTPKPIKAIKPKKSKGNAICPACLNTIPNCACVADKSLMAALGFKNASIIPAESFLQSLESHNDGDWTLDTWLNTPKFVSTSKPKLTSTHTIDHLGIVTDNTLSAIKVDPKENKYFKAKKPFKSFGASVKLDGDLTKEVKLSVDFNSQDYIQMMKGEAKTKKPLKGSYDLEAPMDSHLDMLKSIPKIINKKTNSIVVQNFCDTKALTCPNCGSVHMKQTSVTVYERATDAATIGTSVTINKEGSFTTEHLEGNPSPRKNAVVITFECINCNKVFDLTLANIKGVTDVRMNPKKK